MFGLSHLFYPWGFLVQIFAIVHFVRRRPENYWFYIIFFGGFLGAGVYILDIVSVFGLKLIEFVDLVLDGLGLPIDPLLTGQGIHVAPEALLRLILQRLAGCVGRIVVGVHRAARAWGALIGSRLSRGGTGLGEGRYT